MNTLEAEEAREVIESGKTVLVDFFATWCGPCMRIAPILEELDEEVPDVEFVKVDVDPNMDFAQELGVMSVPTLILFKGGEEVDRLNGALPKDKLAEFVTQ